MQDLTKKKVSDFLHGHTAYELIPESGKVVLLDVDLPVRQAFHALHEQVSPGGGCWSPGGGGGAYHMEMNGMVVLLDVDLPLRQAFHALHEQVCPGAGAEGAVSERVRRGMLDARGGGGAGSACAQEALYTLHAMSDGGYPKEASPDKAACDFPSVCTHIQSSLCRAGCSLYINLPTMPLLVLLLLLPAGHCISPSV